MSSKDNLYGLFSPKKLNPNIIAVAATLVIITIILVYSGRHNKITVTKALFIETNIPQPGKDSLEHASQKARDSE